MTNFINKKLRLLIQNFNKIMKDINKMISKILVNNEVEKKMKS